METARLRLRRPCRRYRRRRRRRHKSTFFANSVANNAQ